MASSKTLVFETPKLFSPFSLELVIQLFIARSSLDQIPEMAGQVTMVVADEKRSPHMMRIAMDFDPQSSIFHSQEEVDEYLERRRGPQVKREGHVSTIDANLALQQQNARVALFIKHEGRFASSNANLVKITFQLQTQAWEALCFNTNVSPARPV